MNAISMHDNRTNKERAAELKQSFLEYKQTYGAVIGVLESHGITIEELENRYYEYLENPNHVQSKTYKFNEYWIIEN